jgi:hypothetical protein
MKPAKDKINLPLELGGTLLKSTVIGLTGGFWLKKRVNK